MVVPAHSLVASCGGNGRSIVIISLLKEYLMRSVLCQFFLRERTQHDTMIYHVKCL